MPTKPARLCTRCRSIVPAGAKCQCQKLAAKQYDVARGTSAERGYGATWQKFRRAYLARNPLCVAVLTDGKPCNAPATDVDHITPVTGPDDLTFWTGPFQALCHGCHARKTGREGGKRFFGK